MIKSVTQNLPSQQFLTEIARDSIVQFQKISILPKRKDWNFLGGGGSIRPKETSRLDWRVLGMGRTWEKFSSLSAKKTQKFETATGKENFQTN